MWLIKKQEPGKVEIGTDGKNMELYKKATEVTEVIAALKHEKIYWKSHKYKIAFHRSIEVSLYIFFSFIF